MNPSPQPNEPTEADEQELVTRALTDDSLPAAQVIAEQAEAAEERFMPRFIP